MSTTLLTTHAVQYATATKQLFSHVSVTILPHDRIGLVGKNGSGKTTLLQILAGLVEPGAGSVTRHCAVGYVPQVSAVAAAPAVALSDWLRAQKCPRVDFERAYAAVFASPPIAQNQTLDCLSGGELTKLHFAVAVAKQPDLLLLDEPTNHLDRSSLAALQAWLRRYTGAVVLVSHNRRFLAENTKSIWELAGEKVSVYGHSYEEYLAQKQQQEAAQARLYNATQKELAALQTGIHRREVKARRATRTAKRLKSEPSRSRGMENYLRNRSEKGIGKTKKHQDEKRAEVEEKLQRYAPARVKKISVPLETSGHTKRLILRAEGLTVSVADRDLVTDVSLRIYFGDRIALLGDNGSGKTLLLQTLLGDAACKREGVIHAGTAVRTAYVDQRYDMVRPAWSLYENVAAKMQRKDPASVYQQLGRFQFSEHEIHRKASELSGGEVARLAFAMVTAGSLDLLVLDEPTNNLDTDAVAVILEALQSFAGALLVVSHDDFFVEGLAVTRTLEIIGQRVKG